jgi:hypothetical protein
MWETGRGKLYVPEVGWMPVPGYRWDDCAAKDVWPEVTYNYYDSDAGPWTSTVALNECSREERIDWYLRKLPEASR